LHNQFNQQNHPKLVWFAKNQAIFKNTFFLTKSAANDL